VWPEAALSSSVCPWGGEISTCLGEAFCFYLKLPLAVDISPHPRGHLVYSGGPSLLISVSPYLCLIRQAKLIVQVNSRVLASLPLALTRSSKAINPQESVKRMDPGSFQWCSVTRLKHRRFSSNIRKHFFTVRVTEHWHGLSREVGRLPS